MSQVLISTKYQVVIPKEVRRNLGLKSGQTVTCILKGGIIHLVPKKSIESLRGIAQGISIKGLREKKDRL